MSSRHYFDVEHPIRFAHRGSRILWPENTWYAFDHAVEDFGYLYVETDVQMTADGVVIVFHDDTLERCTDGVGRVADWTWEDLRDFDAAHNFTPDGESFPLRGTGIGISRLDDTFDRYPDLCLNIDLKADGSEWAVAEVIRKMGREDTVLVGSFSDARIAKFRRVTKGRVATSAGPRDSIAMYAASRIGRAAPARGDAYQLPYKTRGVAADRRLINAVHRAGKQIHLWTVNDRDEMEKFLDLDVDGIITDRPDILNKVLEERANAQG
ncbi:MAG: glycerophosphodiester phosphodiesterase [Actinomycetia bacterium]|nr:glycerophosphodiester phosphodiesterase [Actinomycetes bacterium]